jgi:hypothetical protein
MQDDGKRHPGPWRIMQVDVGLAGVLIAAALVVLGLVGLPMLAPVFLLGALPVGIAVALVLRSTRKG